MQDRPTHFRWVIFGLGCATSWTLYLHRYLFALIKPELKEEWKLSNEQLGMLDSTFSLCYSLFQFPAGVAADLGGVHLFLGGLILMWSLALGMHAWAPDFKVLALARGLFGASQAGAFASVSRLSRTWFPAQVRTSMQGWMAVFSGRMGGLSANVLFATVMMGMLLFDWRDAVYLLSAAGLILGVAFLALYRNSPRKHPFVNDAEADWIEGQEPGEQKPAESEAADSQSPGESPPPAARRRMPARELLGRMNGASIHNLAFLNLTSIFSTMADNIFSNWIPLFLFQVHNLEYKEMGFYSALPLFGGACGGVFGGFLNDRLIRATGNRRWTRSLIGFGGKAVAGVLLFASLLFYNNPYLFCGLLFFVKFFADISVVTRWGTITDIGGKATASVFAFNNAIAGIGAVTAPLIYGFVSESKTLGWPIVFVIAGVMYFLCAAGWLMVNCTIPVLKENPPKAETEKD